MRCPACGFDLNANEPRCPQCGARWTEEPSGLNLDLPLADADHRRSEHAKLRGQQAGAAGIQWGGYTRRSLAFLVDLIIVALFSLLLCYLTNVALRVGVALNQRRFSLRDFATFSSLCSWGALFLYAWYFTLFHGIAGKTVGKWLLGLRVVGSNQTPITYRQALVRWIGYSLSGFLGLGFMWIMISRERRGWHDYLARTWVIRDRAGETST
jgi:uncharacterized RDD family membrane protein YckC